MPARAVRTCAAFGMLLLATRAASADDTMSLPCAMPAAVALADRPGTGRTTSSGGAPCVVPLGEIVLESGLRRQSAAGAGGSDTLTSGPLWFVRAGIAPRLEVGIAPPARELRSVGGTPGFDNAGGWTDVVVAAKYLVLDTGTIQVSAGAAYSPPTGSGEFTNGLPTYSASVNAGIAVTPRLSLATSQTAGTAIGADADGRSRPYFVFAPSFTLAYALDAVDTALLQDAIVSRQGPLAPAGNRAFVALQRALGTRLSVDAEYEHNFAPPPGLRQNALGFGFVWIVAPPHAPHVRQRRENAAP